MLPSQQKLLILLKNRDFTPKELQRKTGLSPDGIRGRLSELRKLNYDITCINGKYHLSEQNGTDVVKKLLTYIEKQNLFRTKLDIDDLHEQTGTPNNQLLSALSYLYHHDQLMQLTKKTVIIYKSI